METSDRETSSPAQPLLQNQSTQHEHGLTKEYVDAVYSKIARKLLPTLFMITAVCYVDRTNISLAAIGMSEDIGISKAQYGIAASLFFVTYIIFQIPSNIMLKRVGAPLWLGAILVGWGITASMTAFVQDEVQLYVMRLALGVFEAGTFPGIYYYLSLFFADERMSYAIGVVCAGLLAGLCISAPLAGGLLSMHGLLGFSGWQWLLFIEGVPSIALGLFIIGYLPKLPSSASFLSVDEQEVLKVDKCMTSKEAASPMSLIKGIVLNLRIWIILVAGIFHGTAKYATQFWTPLWIDAIASGEGLNLDKGASGEGHKRSGILAAFLSTIPYSLAAAASIAMGWSSTRFKERKYHIIVTATIAGTLFVLLPIINDWGVIAGIVALTFINCCLGGVNGPFMSLVVSCMTNENKGFGFAWYNAVGNLCGLVGPLVVGQVVHVTGSYIASLYFSAIVLFIAIGIVMVIKDTNNH